MSDEVSYDKQDDAENDVGDDTKKPDEGSDEEIRMTVRVLIDSAISGRLIGKGGVTIKKMRSDSAAFIDVGTQVRGASKRIVTVKGPIDNVLTALSYIAETLAAPNKHEDHESKEKSDYSQTSIVLLVHNAQVGCIIGKGGATIRETRESSGAVINVSEHTLDMSSEKTVTIKGAVSNVRKALGIIIQQLCERQDRASPTNPYVPRPTYDSFGFQDSFSIPFSNLPFPNLNNYNLAQAVTTVIVPVPESMIGRIIGKKGATIKDIRSRSLAQVTIPEPQQGDSDRMVTVTGTRQANEVAVALIYEKMNSFDPNRQTSRNHNSDESSPSLQDQS